MYFELERIGDINDQKAYRQEQCKMFFQSVPKKYFDLYSDLFIYFCKFLQPMNLWSENIQLEKVNITF